MKRTFKSLASIFLMWTLLVGGLVQPVDAAPASGDPAPIPVPPGVRYVTTVEGISQFDLPNGLRVLLFPDESVQNVTINMTYLVGSRLENYGETGMAHLLEHMMFKGSKNHRNIPQELSEHGAHSNASTWVDRTNFYETVQATENNLNWALSLEADRMVNSFIAKKDLDTEMTVVRNEYESGENDPSSIMVERALETAYLWHNYGHPTIGARSDIENVPIEHLQAFYHLYYQPDNAILAVAGGFDAPRTLARIAHIFGAIPRPKRQLPTFYTVEPTQDGEREVTLRRDGDVQDVGVLYHVPPGPHEDFPALDVFVQAMTDAPSGRLYTALVDTKKATSVSGSTYQLHDPGVAYFTAEVRPQASLDVATQALVTAVERDVQEHPITVQEVERAKNSILKQLELSMNDSQHVGLELSEWEAMGDWRLLFLYRDRLTSVTPADVQRVALKYFKPSNRTLARFLPTKQPDRVQIPPVTDVASLVSGYKGKVTVSRGERFEASPQNIEKRLTRVDVGGIKLTLLKKRTRGNMVRLEMTLHFGNEESLRGKAMIAAMAGSMLMRGTQHHTRQQLKDEFDRLKARVSVDGDVTSATVSVETVSDNLPQVMALVAEILREPSFPEKEFETLRQEYLSAYEQNLSDPEAVGNNALSRHMAPFPRDDIRYVATPQEDVDEVKTVTLDQVKAFHRGFYGASFGEIAVVGDFDASSFPATIRRLFGDWKAPVGWTRVPSVYHDVPALDRFVDTPDKENAYYISGMEIAMNSDDPDYPAMVLGNYILGGGFLNSRLATRLRQKEGLSYGVGSYFSANALDKQGEFGAYAIYAPQNGQKVKQAVREVLETAFKDGFTDKEVEAAKVGILQSRQVERAKDSALVARLQSYRYIGRTMAWDVAFENKLRALTAKQIVEALRRHIDLTKLNVVMAGDLKKATR